MLVRTDESFSFNIENVLDIKKRDNGIVFSGLLGIGHEYYAYDITIGEFLKLYSEAKKNNEPVLDLTIKNKKEQEKLENLQRIKGYLLPDNFMQDFK